MTSPTFLDLFAGAGDLSEGFIQSSYNPVVHVEMDEAACYTLKTRLAYHWLKKHNQMDKYDQYLSGKISRDELYKLIPPEVLDSVLNEKIDAASLPKIFTIIDRQLKGKQLDFIIGGPPCQAYSLVGRSRDKNGMKGDERNYLYMFYAQFLERYQPKFFVFENVTGLLSARDQEGQKYFDKMKSLFEKIGYTTEYSVIDTSDHGVPQARKRVILVGKLNGECGFYPQLEKSQNKVSVNEVLKDLPYLNAGEGSHLLQKLESISFEDYLYQADIRDPYEHAVTWHQTRPHSHQDLEIYRRVVEYWNQEKQRLDYNQLPEHLKTHTNRKSFTDRFKVVAEDIPSHTVVAHISKDGHYYIHPDIAQNRSLSVREAARLQTFPDSYYFESVSGKPSRTAAFKQIGNAVPVLLAKKIAFALKAQTISPHQQFLVEKCDE